MADIMQQPRGQGQTDLPVHPVVSGSANQTNARVGGGMVVVRPTAPADPVTGLRPPVALQPAALAPAVAQPQSAVPELNGLNTFRTPINPDAAKAGLAALFGIEQKHALPSDPVPDATSDPANSTFLRDNYQQMVNAHMHAINNPHQYTDADYVRLFAGKPWGYVKQVYQALQPPTMQEQAQRAYLASRLGNTAAATANQGPEVQESATRAQEEDVLKWLALGQAGMVAGAGKP